MIIKDLDPVRFRRQTEPTIRAVQPRTLQWRKIALLITPVALAGGNLIAAHYEKLAGIKRGENKFIELEQSGGLAKASAIKIGIGNGDRRASVVLAEARNHAQAELAIGQKGNEVEIRQGKDTGAIPIALSQGLISALFRDSDRLARLIFEREQFADAARYGIEIVVDSKAGSFTVGKIGDTESERQGIAQRQLGQYEVRRKQIEELKQRMILDGAREYATFVGVPICNSERLNP